MDLSENLLTIMYAAMSANLITEHWTEDQEIVIKCADGENLAFENESFLKLYLQGMLKSFDLSRLTLIAPRSNHPT